MTASTEARNECASEPTTAQISERTAQYITQAPDSQKTILSRAFHGTASPRAAIKAKCLTCCHFDRTEVRHCPAVLCPLHRYRPFQDKGEAR